MANLKNRAQIYRYLLVGGTATIIDFSLLFVVTHLGTQIIVANIISTGISFCFSFLANKNYTFKTHGASLRREISSFVVVTLFGLWVIQSIIIGFAEPLLAVVVDASEAQLFIAKTIATIFTTIWNYVLYSSVVFTHKKPSDDSRLQAE